MRMHRAQFGWETPSQSRKDDCKNEMGWRVRNRLGYLLFGALRIGFFAGDVQERA